MLLSIVCSCMTCIWLPCHMYRLTAIMVMNIRIQEIKIVLSIRSQPIMLKIMPITTAIMPQFVSVLLISVVS